MPRFTPTPEKRRRAVRISTVTALKSCLFAGPGELPHTGSRAVVFSRRPGRADHRLMRNSCVPHPFRRLNPLGASRARGDRTGGRVGRLRRQRPNPRRIGLRAYRAMSDLERFGTPGARHSAPGTWTGHKDAGDIPWSMRRPTMHRAHPRGSSAPASPDEPSADQGIRARLMPQCVSTLSDAAEAVGCRVRRRTVASADRRARTWRIVGPIIVVPEGRSAQWRCGANCCHGSPESRSSPLCSVALDDAAPDTDVADRARVAEARDFRARLCLAVLYG